MFRFIIVHILNINPNSLYLLIDQVLIHIDHQNLNFLYKDLILFLFLFIIIIIIIIIINI
jgi:hypothetical protein